MIAIVRTGLFVCLFLMELTLNFRRTSIFEVWSDKEPAVFLWELSQWLINDSVKVHSYLSELG